MKRPLVGGDGSRARESEPSAPDEETTHPRGSGSGGRRRRRTGRTTRGLLAMGLSLALVLAAWAGVRRPCVSGFSSSSSTAAASSRRPLKGAGRLQVGGGSGSGTSTKQLRTKRKRKASKFQRKGKFKKGGRGGGHRKSAPGHGSARIFNSQLTKCDSVSELLSAFMGQTSRGNDDNDGGSNDEGVSKPTSAATHLAGAGKVNSVNFSTCLHRLARFAARPNNLTPHARNDGGGGRRKNGDREDERKKALSDPRFALLVCSMAEMAAGCDASISVGEGNAILEEWKKNDRRSSSRGEVREADDVLDAIAGATSGGGGSRGSGSGDADGAARAMAKLSGGGGEKFSSRECSNVCWALAKLRMAPPGDALPLGRVDGLLADADDAAGANSESLPRRRFSSMDEMSLDAAASSLEVRRKLFEEAKNRRAGGGGGGGGGTGGGGGWIPELSRLAGKVLDLVAMQIVEEYGRRGDGVVDKRGMNFNPQEMASIMWAFAKSKRGDHALFDTAARELMRATQQELRSSGGGQGTKPQELSNTIWAFATAGIRGNTQVEMVRFIADTLDEGEGQFFGLQFKPQELSNTAWALATLHSKREPDSATEAIEDDGIVRVLRWVARDIARRVDSFKPQELSNSVWAFSTVGFGYDEACGTNSHNDYVHAATDDPAGDKELVYETLEVIAENALSRMDKFKGQELNNMAWGFARLGHRTERAGELFRGVAGELIRETWRFKPQDVCTTLWSFATAEYFDYDAFRAGVSRLNFRHIRSFKPQEMSNTVWALATAGFAPRHAHAFDTSLVPASRRPTREQVSNDPVTECFAAVASEAMRRPHEFKDQELKDVLWSFSKIGVRHPALFQKIAKHIVGRNGRGFSSFSSQGLGNTLWSFAKQAQLSQEVIDSLGDSVKLVSTGRLAVYETSCLDNGEDVIKRLFVRAAEAGMNMGLDRFTNQDLSNTVWACSTLGLLHTAFFKRVEREVVSRLKQKRNKFRGQEIANILWSFATLNAQPDPMLVDQLSVYVASECRGKNGIDEYSIAKMFGQRQELANLAWSCAVIGRYPKELMNILYTGLLGTSNDPEQMKLIFKDDGLQKSSIMTLYYVQVAADVEAPELRLSLPVGFPNGWGEDDEGHGHQKGDENDLIDMSSSMLTLTVSKLQKGVSRTFDRIGFDNVLEHLIDTNEIEGEYGVQLPQSPTEFLSVDIANVGKKIGVEVDGPGHFVCLVDRPGKTTSLVGLENQFDDRGERRVNGPTILKHRLLAHLGWDIIHLPYWEYQELGGDREKEMDYCQSLLEQSSKW